MPHERSGGKGPNDAHDAPDAAPMSNRLPVLDEAIRKGAEALAAGQRRNAELAWNLGKNLIERKGTIAHGEWAAYVAGLDVSERSARDYMRMGREIGSAADLGPSIRATLDELDRRKATAATLADLGILATEAAIRAGTVQAAIDEMSRILADPDPDPDVDWENMSHDDLKAECAARWKRLQHHLRLIDFLKPHVERGGA